MSNLERRRRALTEMIRKWELNDTSYDARFNELLTFTAGMLMGEIVER